MIYSLTCKRCGFQQVGPRSQAFVRKDDGSEVQIGFPCPTEKYRELARQGRVVERHGLVCLGCGALGYFGPSDHGEDEDCHERLALDGRYSCGQCGDHSFHPVVGRARGCGRFVARLLYKNIGESSFYPVRANCPRCRIGVLTSSLCAIT